MPASGSIIKGAQPIEYVEETTFATAETDATYEWIGAVTQYSGAQEVVAETANYLPSSGASNKLEQSQNQKVSEAWGAEMTYHPQDVDFFQYITGAVDGLSDDVTPIQIGEQNEDSGEYRRILGCVAESFELTIQEDSLAEISASFLAADAEDWSETDYVETGSHATEDTSDILTYDDLGNVTLGGSALDDYISGLTLSIEIDLVVVKDPDSTRASHIEAIVPVDREVTVSLEITYDDMSMASDVRSYTAQDLAFDFPSSTSWTVSDVQFPEFPYEFGPDDLVGDSLESDRCSNLTYA